MAKKLSENGGKGHKNGLPSTPSNYSGSETEEDTKVSGAAKRKREASDVGRGATLKARKDNDGRASPDVASVPSPSPSGERRKGKDGQEEHLTYHQGGEKLRDMAAQQNLPGRVVEKGLALLDRLREARLMKLTITVVATALFIACRQEKIPCSYKEICAIAGVARTKLAHCQKTIMKAFDLHDLEPVTATETVMRFCANLQLPEDIREGAVSVSNRALEAGIVDGKCPISVAAAAICIVSGCSDKDIVRVCNVSLTTVRSCINRLRENGNTLLKDVKVRNIPFQFSSPTIFQPGHQGLHPDDAEKQQQDSVTEDERTTPETLSPAPETHTFPKHRKIVPHSPNNRHRERSVSSQKRRRHDLGGDGSPRPKSPHHTDSDTDDTTHLSIPPHHPSRPHSPAFPRTPEISRNPDPPSIVVVTDHSTGHSQAVDMTMDAVANTNPPGSPIPSPIAMEENPIASPYNSPRIPRPDESPNMDNMGEERKVGVSNQMLNQITNQIPGVSIVPSPGAGNEAFGRSPGSFPRADVDSVSYVTGDSNPVNENPSGVKLGYLPGVHYVQFRGTLEWRPPIDPSISDKCVVQLTPYPDPPCYFAFPTEEQTEQTQAPVAPPSETSTTAPSEPAGISSSNLRVPPPDTKPASAKKATGRGRRKRGGAADTEAQPPTPRQLKQAKGSAPPTVMMPQPMGTGYPPPPPQGGTKTWTVPAAENPGYPGYENQPNPPYRPEQPMYTPPAKPENTGYAYPPGAHPQAAPPGPMAVYPRDGPQPPPPHAYQVQYPPRPDQQAPPPGPPVPAEYYWSQGDPRASRPPPTQSQPAMVYPGPPQPQPGPPPTMAPAPGHYAVAQYPPHYQQPTHHMPPQQYPPQEAYRHPEQPPQQWAPAPVPMQPGHPSVAPPGPYAVPVAHGPPTQPQPPPPGDQYGHWRPQEHPQAWPQGPQTPHPPYAQAPQQQPGQGREAAYPPKPGPYGPPPQGAPQQYYQQPPPGAAPGQPPRPNIAPAPPPGTMRITPYRPPAPRPAQAQPPSQPPGVPAPTALPGPPPHAYPPQYYQPNPEYYRPQ